MQLVKIYSLIAVAIAVLCLYGLFIAFSQNKTNTERIVKLEQEVKLLKTSSINSSVQVHSKIGREAPNFELKDLYGKIYTLNKFTEQSRDVERGLSLAKNEVIILAWVKDCQPCKMIIPEFNKFYQRRKNKVTILSVTLLKEEKEITILKKFIQKQNILFPVLIADEKFLQNYAPFTTPTLWVINKNGKFKEIYVGVNEIMKIIKRFVL